MSPMQKELYRGRTLSCNNCAKTFVADDLVPLPVETPKPWGPVESSPLAAPDLSALAPQVEPQPQRQTKAWVVALWVGGGVVATIGLLLMVLLPPLQRAREQANRVQCANNMRQLGQAMMIYANTSGGRYPDRVDRLLAYMPAGSFVCPSTSDTPASGTTPQLLAADLAKGSHFSYVYVGQNYSTGSLQNPAVTIVLYEPLANHNDGINVLYADGSVNFLNRGMAVTTIAMLSARQPAAPVGPPLPAATQPATQPATAPATQPEANQ
jgi:prepilin-type processing-associated H-X9-DG protein